LFATYRVRQFLVLFPQKLVTLPTRFFDRMVHKAHWINLAWPQPAARTRQQSIFLPMPKPLRPKTGVPT
jgi:hypothetical protein